MNIHQFLKKGHPTSMIMNIPAFTIQREKKEKEKRKMDHILFHKYPNTRERKSNSAYREGETIGNFENATNIQPKKLSCDHSLRKFLAVFNNFQNNLPCKKKIRIWIIKHSYRKRDNQRTMSESEKTANK